MEYDLIYRAGLTRQEAANIIGVSHVILWKWETQGVLPRPQFKGVPLRHRVETFLRILDKLIERGSLPLPNLTFSKRMDDEMKARRAALVAKLKSLLDSKVAALPANE